MAKFQKGVSGNPKGKPPGAKNHTTGIKELIQGILAEEQQVSITEGGKERKIIASKLEVLIRTCYALAIKGDAAARKEILDRGYGRPVQPMDFGTSGEGIRIIIGDQTSSVGGVEGDGITVLGPSGGNGGNGGPKG